MVAGVPAPLGLRPAPEKTRVLRIDEGYDFLGHHLRRQRKRGTNKHYVYTKPSTKAVQAIKDKVSAKTHRSTRNQDLAELILGFHRMLRGWANYFRHGASKAIFGAIDSHTWARLLRWIRRKYAGKAPARDDRVQTPLLRQGLEDRPSGSRLHGRIQRQGGAYRYRGVNIAAPRIPIPAAAASG
ncbi:group II intron maturase-specific domain-containing protein [Nonomuraea sp. NPDC049480]|uniref:group II intron maturase-specific domain-containing protein n=1 Tax=Nonomuraea sp. NPDC049480 TaxID=3364353 RepID=UPI0037B1EA73